MAYNTTNKTIPTEYEIIYDTVFNTNLNIIEIQEIIKNMNWEEKIKEMDENGYIEDIGHKRFYIMLGILCMIPGIALLGFIIYIDFIYIPYKVDNL